MTDSVRARQLIEKINYHAVEAVTCAAAAAETMKEARNESLDLIRVSSPDLTAILAELQGIRADLGYVKALLDTGGSL